MINLESVKKWKVRTRVEIVPKETEIDSSFDTLKRASERATRAILRGNVPEMLRKNVGTKVMFSIKADSCKTVFHVVAVFQPIHSSADALVVIRYTDALNMDQENRFKLRPWHDYANGWKIGYNSISAMADKGDTSGEIFLDVLRATSSESYNITLSNSFSVKNRGKNLLDVVTRNIYWNLLKKQKE